MPTELQSCTIRALGKTKVLHLWEGPLAVTQARAWLAATPRGPVVLQILLPLPGGASRWSQIDPK